MERATFDDLIARKLQKAQEREKTKDIAVPSLGKTLSFERPSDTEIVGFMDELSEASGASGVYAMYKNMIYHCCPALRSDKLREAFGAVDPTDTVPMIMDAADVMETGENLAAFLGILKLGDEVKN